MEKWIEVELRPEEIYQLKVFLKSHNIYYEASGCFNLVHFEIKAINERIYQMINDFIERIE